MALTTDICAFLEGLLNTPPNQDYCPNGLQIEGCADVLRIASAVTASLASIEKAASGGAQLLLVHHGIFWQNDNPCIFGPKRSRIAKLLKHDINLVAYHLPLDKHPIHGNNALLAQQLGVVAAAPLVDDPIVFGGEFAKPIKASEFALHIEKILGRKVLHLAGDKRPIKRVAICTGGGQSRFGTLSRKGFDAFITGEATESSYHLARESGVHYYAAGHYATERFGIQSIANQVAERFGVENFFIEEENPV